MKENVYIDTDTVELVVEEETRLNPYLEFNTGETLSGANERSGGLLMFDIEGLEE